MSASAPAGSASSMTGMLSAASTSATIEGDEESEVINQPEPTSCIQVPTLDTIVAIHRLRNRAFRSGLQGEAWVAEVIALATPQLTLVGGAVPSSLVEKPGAAL